MSIHQSSDIHVHNDQPIELVFRELTDCPIVLIRAGGETMSLFTLFLHDPSADAAQSLSDQFALIADKFHEYAGALAREEGVLL